MTSLYGDRPKIAGRPILPDPLDPRYPLDEGGARALTDAAKAKAEELWSYLVRLYEGEAHKALGYDSWGAYFEAEFGQSRRHGYRLLEAGRVLDVVSDQSVTPPNEAQARELAPLLDEPDKLREAWQEARETAEEEGTKVDAGLVRVVVGRRVQEIAPSRQGARLSRRSKAENAVRYLLTAIRGVKRSRSTFNYLTPDDGARALRVALDAIDELTEIAARLVPAAEMAASSERFAHGTTWKALRRQRWLRLLDSDDEKTQTRITEFLRDLDESNRPSR